MILGASRVDQLDATLAAAELQLAAEIKSALDDLTIGYRDMATSI